MSEHKTLAIAFLAAQAEFPEIPKDKENPHFKSRYSSLDAIQSACRPILNKHGLLLYHETSLAADVLTITAVVEHAASGEKRSNAMSMAAGANVQGIGSQVTYLRRYTAAPLLGVCSDEDDDGNAGRGEQRPQRQATKVPPKAPPKAEPNGKPAPAFRDFADLLSQLGACANSKEAEPILTAARAAIEAGTLPKDAVQMAAVKDLSEHLGKTNLYQMAVAELLRTHDEKAVDEYRDWALNEVAIGNAWMTPNQRQALRTAAAKRKVEITDPQSVGAA